MSANIKEIAEKTGLSISTISRALRSQTAHLVKPETQRLIQSVVKKEGYVPQRAAINLVKKRTGIVGLAIPYFIPHIANNDYFGMVISGVMSAIAESEFELKFIILPEGDLNQNQIHLIESKQMDGLVVAGWPTINQFEEILESKMPLVVINDFDANVPNHFVYADHFHGGYLAGKHFMDLGYETIAVTSADPEWFPDMEQRLEGFKKALTEAHFPMQNFSMIPAGVSEESGYEAIKQQLSQGGLPRAIFFQNDISAIGALKAIREKGVSCPEDVAVMGYDNIRLGSYTTPSLSTIEQPVFEMAQEAAKILTKFIDSSEASVIVKKHPVKLVVRESCGGKRV